MTLFISGSGAQQEINFYAEKGKPIGWSENYHTDEWIPFRPDNCTKPINECWFYGNYDAFYLWYEFPAPRKVKVIEFQGGPAWSSK